MTYARPPAVVPAEERPVPVSRAAVVGVLGAAAWVLAYFVLPWITFTPAQRERLRAALEPSLVRLEARDAETAERYRDLLADVQHGGALSGRDLHRYARAAAALHRSLEGEAPDGPALDRSTVIQRALPLAAALLAGLPAASAVAALLLLARSLRRPGSLALTVLVVTGTVGSALSLSWERWADALGSDVLRGTGLSTALAASLAMASAGLFGVKAGTWWKVYGLSLLLLAGGGLAAWAHVVRGWAP